MAKKIPDIAHSNPALEGPIGMDSTTEDSTEHFGLDSEHAQFDDAEANIPASEDPNLTGTTPTNPPLDWMAGSMSGWSENDDYREFFEEGNWPVSRLQMEYCQKDNDYDDNGQIPTALGEGHGVRLEDVDLERNGPFGIHVVSRRI